MKILPTIFRPSRASKKRGLTLVELMVSLGVAFLLLAGLAVVFVTAFRSFSSMGNYVAMDSKSREALDQLTRDIRKSKDIVSCTSNVLVLNYDGVNNLTYSYQTDSRSVTRQVGALAATTLLPDCSTLQFKMYQKIPQAGGSFSLATNVTSAKCIEVIWKCSRFSFGAVTNTDDMQQAVIIIRNKLAN